MRVGGAAPPAASRCSARTSLRAPSRGDPPRTCCPPSERPYRRYGFAENVSTRCADHRIGIWDACIGRSPIMRGVGAGRSAQRGTSGAATGPRGAAGPHNPKRVRILLFGRDAGSPDPYLRRIRINIVLVVEGELLWEPSEDFKQRSLM